MMKIKKMYDMSQPVYHNCPGWPDYPMTNISADYRIGIHGFNSETVSMNLHTGTHLDVPYHFFEDGKAIDQYPPEAFMGPGVFCDLRHKAPDTPITVEDLAPYLPLMEKGDVAVLNTGFGPKRAMTDEYLHRWPYLSGPGAEALVKAGVKAVGIDGLSVGGWGSPEKGRPSHLVLLEAGVIAIEEVLVPDELMDGKKRLVSFFPLLFRGCSGSPVRMVAYEFE